MTKKVLIVTLPPMDPSKPPAIFSILGGCCESLNIDYQLLDLNLYMYKTLPTSTTVQLVNDFSSNEIRSSENLEHYKQLCQYAIEQIKLYRPTHIAISVFTYVNILATDIFLKYIRDSDIDYNFQIIVGGLGIGDIVPTITKDICYGEYAQEQNLVDYCIYGEGEIAFIELLKGNANYPGINNNNPIQIKDLDSLPMPSYQLINPTEYFYSDLPEILITGSRGCVRDCTFCNVSTYWKKYVYKSGQRIADEIFNIWKTTGVQKIDFTDSLINGSITSFRELNRALIKYRDENPKFNPMYRGQFICRPKNQLKEQDYIEMQKAGAHTLVVGIESFSNSIRNHMRKKFDNDAIDWHFEMCAKYGIKNVLLLISGYVTETLEDHQINLDYLKKYQKYALSRVIYSINIEVTGLLFSGTLGSTTPLHSMIESLGVHFYTESQHGTLWISDSNPTLTPKERLRRGLEIVLTAHDLGFKVLHINQKVDAAQTQFDIVQKLPQKKFFKLNVS